MRIAAILLTLALLVACSGNKQAETAEKQARDAKLAQQKAAEPKAPELSTGREAFQRMYVAARGWAPDARPYRLQSEVTPDANGQNGRATLWRGYFASPSRRAIKTFAWSGGGSPDSRGISSTSEDTYNPANAATQTFDIAFLKVDSDKAVEAANRERGAKLLKTNPDQPITYALDWNGRESALLWHVIYGENRNEAKLTVAVNASTGQYMRVEK